jgi:NitT/TauT family transport system substrate-binding protein/putative hydroxymethylpyrimidine transport system substrate-binding protein
VNVFRVDRYGAPSYPETVFVALRSTLRAHRDEIVRALAAIAQGARATERQPAVASAVIAQAAGGDMKLISAQTKAIAPALWPALTLDRTMLEEWSAFGARTGLLPHKLDIAGAFDFTVAPAALAVAKQ